jgi:hypothetical protein
VRKITKKYNSEEKILKDVNDSITFYDIFSKINDSELVYGEIAIPLFLEYVSLKDKIRIQSEEQLKKL